MSNKAGAHTWQLSDMYDDFQPGLEQREKEYLETGIRAKVSMDVTLLDKDFNAVSRTKQDGQIETITNDDCVIIAYADDRVLYVSVNIPATLFSEEAQILPDRFFDALEKAGLRKIYDECQYAGSFCGIEMNGQVANCMFIF